MCILCVIRPDHEHSGRTPISTVAGRLWNLARQGASHTIHCVHLEVSEPLGVRVRPECTSSACLRRFFTRLLVHSIVAWRKETNTCTQCLTYMFNALVASTCACTLQQLSFTPRAGYCEVIITSCMWAWEAMYMRHTYKEVY